MAPAVFTAISDQAVTRAREHEAAFAARLTVVAADHITVSSPTTVHYPVGAPIRVSTVLRPRPRVLVVPGTSRPPDHQLTAGAAERATYAAGLSSRYDLIIVSGCGYPTSEAEQLAHYFTHTHTPVVWDAHATSTAANAVNSAFLVAALGEDPIVDSVASASNAARQHLLFRTVHSYYRTTITRYGHGHHHDWKAGVLGLRLMSRHLREARHRLETTMTAGHS